MTQMNDTYKAKREDYYGIPVDEMSFKQLRSAAKFAATVEPWLIENIGEFGKEWTVVLDRAYDDFRLQFPDKETETWFWLAWMHGAREDLT